ncbi:DUF6233 domain-containing protein [Streptomyces sp. t39]|uniref:DUF6233 domain-containing protein n=1 Tax=Streptomyces sp. t39 TaxID=1828156 RepID=UPI0011CDE67A|nr:DUF6233 domain-containing protein [Streptomyces sp. t39]
MRGVQDGGAQLSGLSLDQVRERIGDLERRKREQRAGPVRRPPVPDWTVETGIGADRPPLYVHVGGCRMASKRVRAVTRVIAA